MIKLPKLPNFLKVFKKHSELKIGDVYATPLDSEAAKNGFLEYAPIEYFYKVIDVNENGVMVNTYLAQPYDNLPAGYKFDKPIFRSHKYLIWNFKNKVYLGPNENITKQFNEIVEN